MYPFTYHRPSSLDDAKARLAASEDGRPLAGGMSLIPTMRFRLASCADLVDLNGIEALAGIERRGDGVRIGAMTRHAAVAASPEVGAAIPALAALAGSIGDVQVRNRGTVGGSICFADPAADYPAGLLGLGLRSTPTGARSPPTTSSPGSTRPRWRTARSWSRSISRFPSAPAGPSSATRPRASPSSR